MALRLQAVTDALSETMTRTEVANVLAREGLVALRAQACSVLLLDAGRDGFEALASSGPAEGRPPSRDQLAAVAEGPAAVAVRTREPVAAESPEEVRSRWPRLAGDRATLTAPLVVGGEAIGALHIGFREARTFDGADRSFVQTLARQCAQALERARLYEEEQHAREQAEKLAARLRRLQTVIDATFTTGSVDELLHELLVRLREAVGSDTATILIVDEAQGALVAGRAIGFEGPTEARVPIGEGFAGRIAETRRHLVLTDISKATVVSPYFETNGIVSLAGVPLVADGRLVGVLHVGSKGKRDFDREELLLLRLVAVRAAVAIDRAREHERERGIAEVLQRSLLPERLPALPDAEVAARYVPGTSGAEVGGDWYDVFELSDGSVGIAVGDVVGHGIRAAASTGRLRHVLRAYAVDGFGPAEALARLNRLACESGEQTFATAVFALVEPSRKRLRLASAGHPPVLVRAADGTVSPVEDGRSLPLGATPEAEYAEVEVEIGAGSTLFLYTDGLVERREETIDTGIARLAGLVGSTDGPLEELVGRVVEQLEEAGHTDDVALLAVRLGRRSAEPTLSLRFPAEPGALAPMRASLRSWLAAGGAGEEEIFDVLVAVNEACTNAVEHPVDPSRSEVTVDAAVADGEISIVVGDSGRWRSERGADGRNLGLGFMRALMERVDVTRSGDGTTVRLRRRLDRKAGR